MDQVNSALDYVDSEIFYTNLKRNLLFFHTYIGVNIILYIFHSFHKDCKWTFFISFEIWYFLFRLVTIETFQAWRWLFTFHAAIF